MSDDEWIGVDLDGTLAFYDHWRGPEHIGTPIPMMFQFVLGLLRQGKTVKIFTARACVPEQIPPVKAWLKQHGLPDLEVTNVKDFKMVTLYDDRCVQIITNMGVPVRAWE